MYGVPLSGSLLQKPGHFPEQRHSGEDNRKKWIEVCCSFLSQQINFLPVLKHCEAVGKFENLFYVFLCVLEL